MRDIPYEVRYERNGEVRYGVVEDYTDEAEKAIKQGKYLVSDCILPGGFILPQAACTPIKWDDKGKEAWEKASYEAAMEQCNSLPDNHLCVGHIFSIGVADGAATYLVTKVTKKWATVEWRGWHNGDRYTDHYFGWSRRCPIRDVWEYVRSELSMRKIFGPNS